jgi:hypothetical protein
MGMNQTIRDRLPPDSIVQAEIFALGDDAVFDMTNLPFSRTGIRGIPFISTAMGSHGPRVKYFEKAGKDQPSFSIAISDTPHVVASSVSAHVLDNMSPDVMAWVSLNRDALLSFWNEGAYWDVDAVRAFIDGLKKI